MMKAMHKARCAQTTICAMSNTLPMVVQGQPDDGKDPVAGAGHARLVSDHVPGMHGQHGLTEAVLFAVEQVMGEDLVLVAGQQDRMLRGADVWGHPVAYDKLGVRYRRWRNSVAAGSSAERAQVSQECQAPCVSITHADRAFCCIYKQQSAHVENSCLVAHPHSMQGMIVDNKMVSE